MVLIDANVLVYYLDETAGNHKAAVSRLQKLLDDDEQLVTSHHVIEEVLHVLSRLEPDADLVKAVRKIALLPDLLLAEPSPDIDFAKRYAKLNDKLKTGINDALLLQLMLDAGITKLFSFDRKLLNRAALLHIEGI